MYIFKNKITDYMPCQEYYFSDLQFKIITADWNNDNDIYTQKVTALKKGYQHSYPFTYEELTDNFTQVYSIKFFDKISKTEVEIKDYEIKEIHKNHDYERIEKGYSRYELVHHDDIVFQFDTILE